MRTPEDHNTILFHTLYQYVSINAYNSFQDIITDPANNG